MISLSTVHDQPLADWLEHDLNEARAYGARAAQLPEYRGVPWEAVAPLLRQGWESRHAELCGHPHGWQPSFAGVRQGWQSAGGLVREAWLAA